MPQTFYIETDEEIISVIGRLRKSSSQENIFVFPKRALVLQSIVNLRLFQREAQKLGKKMIIVTQDEVGRMLAQKAGIETEQYSEEFSQRGAHVELSSAQAEVSAAKPAPLPLQSDSRMPNSDAIGSSEFYTPQTADLPPLPQPLSQPVPDESKKLRIRNASPEKLPSLNSKRFNEEIPARPSLGVGASSQSQDASRENPAYPGARPLPQTEQPAKFPASPLGNDREERLRNFFSAPDASAKTPFEKPVPQKSRAASPSVAIAGKKAHTIFFLLGGVSLLSLIGVALFLFLPKAEIHVTPYKITQNIDMRFEGRTDGNSGGENSLPARLVEKERSVSFSVAATGKSGASNQKARGTVVISNEFSSEPQTLIATTRLETPDGKLFRLTESVTVPGMTSVGGKNEPGAIEANVIADQAGEDYNIGPTTFAIPGFKGGPKYAKFSAKSSKAMTGGGSGGSEVSVISKADTEKAESEAKEKAREAFLQEIRGELLPDEKVLEEDMEITALNAAAMPQAGTAAASFDYQNTFKIRAFIFSEKEIKNRIESQNKHEVQGAAFRPVDIVLSYGESLPNYNEGTVALKAHALVTLESVIDREKLQKALLGQDQAGIEQALESFPAVKKIEVRFNPEWFVTSIPKSEDRALILVEPGEE